MGSKNDRITWGNFFYGCHTQRGKGGFGGGGGREMASISHYAYTDPTSRERGGQSKDRTLYLLTRSLELYPLSYNAPPPSPR